MTDPLSPTPSLSTRAVLELLAKYAEAVQRHLTPIKKQVRDGFNPAAASEVRAKYGDTEAEMHSLEDELGQLDPAHLRSLAVTLPAEAEAEGTEKVFQVGISTIQRVDKLLHEAERWSDHPRMESLLSEAIVLMRGIVYPLPEITGASHAD